ncbi:MAG: substrate-binding domain-containing protein [Sulfuricurvum sp.]
MPFFVLNITFLVLFFLPFPLIAAQRYTIAFAQDTLANDFRKAQVAEVQKAVATHPNWTFLSSDAHGETALLIHQINHFIDCKVDLIIVGTNDEKAVVPIIAKAYHQGIKVLILDRGIQGGDYTTFIHSDNRKIGQLGARYIAQRLKGKGVVLLLEGLANTDVTRLRTQGFREEMAHYPHIHVIKRRGNYLRSDTIHVMEPLLAFHTPIDAIFSESDSMLSGARLVLNRHGIPPQSLITVGCDYTSEAKKAIHEGTQSASILFPLGGVQSVAVAERLFKGKKVPKEIRIPVQLITPDNVRQIKAIF